MLHHHILPPVDPVDLVDPADDDGPLVVGAAVVVVVVVVVVMDNLN